MSMISAQCDELRKAAQTCRTLGRYEMEQTLLQAVDTITELRGALQVASVDYRHLSEENAKLRELLRVAITYCVNGYCGKDDGCPLRLTDYDCQLLTKASELGVEEVE